MNASQYLSANGAAAQRLPGFELRPQQLDMATAVERALEGKRKLLIEAGTGVGKSFAYLLPAALWAINTKERVLISTGTINLQEQLMQKDIPFIRDELKLNFSSYLAKGRGNYLCLRRLLAANSSGSGHFDSFMPEDLTYTRKLEDWFYKSQDGSLSTLDFDVPQNVWAKVRVERDACTGKRCRYFNTCPYFRDRKLWESADLLVVNHSLFFSDLSLRMGEAPLLPGYGAVIFDEAHGLEDSASSHFGVSLRRSGAISVLRRIFDDRYKRGFFSSSQFFVLQRQSLAFGAVINKYFGEVGDFVDNGGMRIRTPYKFPDDPISIGNTFLSELESAASDLEPDSDICIEAYASFSQVKEIVMAIEVFNAMSMPDYVYWADGKSDDPEIHAVPVSVARKLSEYLWEREMPIVLTSATLATNRRDKCKYIRSRLGIDEADEMILGSPFDYERQVKIFIPSDVPDPTADADAYRASLVRYIRGFVETATGGTFVLFTNLRDMKFCHDELIDQFTNCGILTLVQDGGTPRTRMLDMFREDGKAVLFGVSSFWQGVDVRGAALSNVIIARLPFEVPNHPLVEARREEIAMRGGADFWEYSLPNAILKLKQGFGRLVRTKNDTGRIVILDPRIRTKSYGRNFLDALPKCPICYEPDSY